MQQQTVNDEEDNKQDDTIELLKIEPSYLKNPLRIPSFPLHLSNRMPQRLTSLPKASDFSQQKIKNSVQGLSLIM